MTQAPTPGPLSGDWPVVTDKWVETYCDLTGRDPDGGSVTFLGDGPVSTSFRDAARREIEAMLCAAPKSAIRSLAPTAPVEASGSEREHGPKCWGKTSISDEMMYCYCGSTDSPHGETREALDRLKMAAHVYEDDEMAADCATLEALLSARPLALGGQQGVQERCQRCGGEVQGWLCQSCPAEFRENDDGHLVFDEDTTPARAEAQDEGAAGEPVAWQIEDRDEGWQDFHPTNEAQKNPAAWAKLGWNVRALYAHPSTPPAAQEGGE